MIWLALLITVVITFLIVMCDCWIKKHKATHPDLYKHRYTFRALVFILLQIDI
jgi:hypothetical protein